MSATPQNYVVQVADKADSPVGADGKIAVNVPPLERGCATYLFGVVKVKDGSPYDVPAIHVKKDGHVVRKLSLNDLKKMPTDSEGYQLIKLK